MDILCCALALLGSVVGAGFASGREIVRFFAAHGAMGFVAVAFSLAALAALFLCLAERLSAAGQTGLPGLCASRFGARVGGVCTALFFLLSAVTGGAMLAACAELSALVWPIRPAYAAGNDDRLNPFFSCQADDLRSEVRMKCVENEQVSLEDLRVQIQLPDELLRILYESRQDLRDINRYHFEVGMVFYGL